MSGSGGSFIVQKDGSLLQVEGLNMDEAVSRAMALAGHSNGETEVREAIEALPRALREAELRQRGLITVSRHAV